MGHENFVQCKFYAYVSIDVTADAASCWTLAAFILTLGKSEPKIWNAYQTLSKKCQSNTIQEA